MYTTILAIVTLASGSVSGANIKRGQGLGLKTGEYSLSTEDITCGPNVSTTIAPALSQEICIHSWHQAQTGFGFNTVANKDCGPNSYNRLAPYFGNNTAGFVDVVSQTDDTQLYIYAGSMNKDADGHLIVDESQLCRLRYVYDAVQPTYAPTMATTTTATSITVITSVTNVAPQKTTNLYSGASSISMLAAPMSALALLFL